MKIFLSVLLIIVVGGFTAAIIFINPVNPETKTAETPADIMKTPDTPDLPDTPDFPDKTTESIKAQTTEQTEQTIPVTTDDAVHADAVPSETARKPTVKSTVKPTEKPTMAATKPPATTPIVDRWVTIMGSSAASKAQMKKQIESGSGGNYKLTCTLDQLIDYFYEEGAAEGVRGDIALCQAIKETGYFRYGNDVSFDQNNFCGLGATGNGVKGESFNTARDGVRAQIQHLKAYASTAPLYNPCIDPRFHYVIRGCAPYWTDLSGRWAVPGYDTKKFANVNEAIAAGEDYGSQVLNVFRQALLR